MNKETPGQTPGKPTPRDNPMQDRPRTSEELLDEVGHIAQIGGWEMDLVTRKAQWTRTTYEIVGLEPGTPPPGPDEHLHYYIEEDRPLVAEAMRALVEDDVPLKFEARARPAHKGIRWFRALGRAIRENGQCVRLVGTLQDITEYKQAMESLRESDNKYKLIFNNVGDAIYIHDTAGKIRAANTLACEQLGYTHDELMAMTVDQVDSPEEARHVPDRLARLIKDGQLTFETVHRRKDGSLVPVEATARQITWDGQPAIISIARDITRRKQAEEALQESGRRYHELFEYSSDALLLIDPVTSQVLEANSVASTMYGYEPDELLTKKSTDLSAEPEETQRRQNDAQTKPRQIIRIPMRLHRKKDGTVFPVEIMARILTGEERPVLLVACRDITESKRAEDALHRSEERYRLLFNKMIDGFALHEIICDGQGIPCDYRFLEVNPAFENLTGLRAADLIGKTVLEALPHTEPEWISTYGRVALNGGSIYFENYSQELGKYYEVAAFSPKKGQFACIFTDITTRKRAEEELVASRNYIRNIVNAVADPIFVKDAGRRFTLVNKALCDLIGRTQEEIIGKSDSDFFPADQVEVFLKKDNELLETGVENINEESITSTDSNEVHTIITRKTRYVDPAGNRFIVGVIRDITERKRAEEVLRESEARFRTVFEAAHMGIVITAPSFVFERVNPAFCDMLGYTAPELSSMTFADITHPEHALQDIENVKKVGRGELPFYKTTKRYIKKTGEIIWGDLIVSSIRDEHGALRYFISMVNDITERKRGEEALQFNNTLLTTQQEVSIDGILVMDENAKILSYNRRFVEMWKIPKQLVEARADEPVLQLVANRMADTESFLQRVQSLYANRKEIGRDELVLADGRVFDRYSAPMFGPAGQYYGRVWYFRDITAHKQMEEELRTHAVLLRDLSAHLQSIREEESKRIAQRIHDELGQALTALKMDLSWMDKHMPPDSPSLTGKVSGMKALIDNTVRIVQRISMELRPSILDDLGLVPAIEWFAGEFQERSGLPCEVRIEPAGLSLDKELSTAFFRIIQESLTNVVRHADATRIRIELLKTANQAELVIGDNGRGLTKEQIRSPRSFGLMQIRERALSHGGEAHFDSAPGKGTTLRITIPLKTMV